METNSKTIRCTLLPAPPCFSFFRCLWYAGLPTAIGFSAPLEDLFTTCNVPPSNFFSFSGKFAQIIGWRLYRLGNLDPPLTGVSCSESPYTNNPKVTLQDLQFFLQELGILRQSLICTVFLEKMCRGDLYRYIF